MSEYFVFYGLLKQGAAGQPRHIDLAAAGAFLGTCTFRGEMYDLGGFPGVTAGDGTCHGVIYRLDDTALLPILDAFEDVYPGDAPGSLYRRERCVATTAGGDTEAWVYVYNQPLNGAPRVPDNNWPLEAGRVRK